MAAKFVTLEVLAEIRDGHEVEILVHGQFCDGWEFCVCAADFANKADFHDAADWIYDNADDLEEQAENEWRQCQYECQYD